MSNRPLTEEELLVRPWEYGWTADRLDKKADVIEWLLFDPDPYGWKPSKRLVEQGVKRLEALRRLADQKRHEIDDDKPEGGVTMTYSSGDGTRTVVYGLDNLFDPAALQPPWWRRLMRRWWG